MSKITIHGLPQSLANDGWWLSSGEGEPPAPPDITSATGRMGSPYGLIILTALIILADRLFWHQTPGLSLVVFAVALSLIIWFASTRSFSGNNGMIGLTLITATILPVIENVQFLSVMFLILGLGIFTVWATLKPGGPVSRFSESVSRFFIIFPIVSIIDLGKQITLTTLNQGTRNGWGNMFKAWVLPLMVGLVFVGLLAAANPILESWLDLILSYRWKSQSSFGRLFFWGFMAAIIWPFIALRRLRHWIIKPLRTPKTRTKRAPRLGLINPISIANSLVLFNLIFAVQTGLDFLYLWSGAELPAGISYATYAHRGAYPLVATALLAGLFALISRPFTEDSDILLLLLVLWLGQTILLVLASLYRLDIYIDIYGLTYLRIAAGIWMCLVAAGLVLIGWQIWQGHSNGWLLQMNMFVLAGVLYSCCFVNFGHIIASSNLAQSNAARIDEFYVCNLGANAAGAIRTHAIQSGQSICDTYQIANEPNIDGWRDWGFRKMRVRGYLAANPENGGRRDKH